MICSQRDEVLTQLFEERSVGRNLIAWAGTVGYLPQRFYVD